MFSNGINLNAASYNNVFSTSSGSLFVPVKPSAVIYSQLDYVHGTAAKSGQNGVPLNKVRILNTLINQLVSMKQKASAPSEEEISGMSEEQKDDGEVNASIANKTNTCDFAVLLCFFNKRLFLYSLDSGK